ncbi:MAG TPA: response regulator [Thermoanaerobaculia bacterium]|nr:response regulator [Thermoanaerobaculia bacterium]
MKKSRLLVVEDDGVIREALRKYFTAAGLQVDCASEIEEAEALVATSRYDVVIADLRLSWSYEGEGLEILRFVRRHSRGTHVIILSGSASADVERSARALGAQDFLHKPMPLPEIGAAVARLLEVH